MTVTVTLSFDTAAAAAMFLDNASRSVRAVLTEADAAADLAGTPRPPKAPAPAPKAEAKAPAPAPKAPPPAPAPKAAEPAAGAIEYPVLQKAVFALAAKDKPAALALAESFGVKSFKDLPAEKWAEGLAAIEAKLAEAAVEVA